MKSRPDDAFAPVYLACWTGGYDFPQMQLFWTEDEARETVDRWIQDATPDGDNIQIIKFTPSEGNIFTDEVLLDTNDFPAVFE